MLEIKITKKNIFRNHLESLLLTLCLNMTFHEKKNICQHGQSFVPNKISSRDYSEEVNRTSQ